MNTNINVLPDGDYIVEVLSMERRTDTQNRKIVEWLLRVAEGVHAGTEFHKRYYMTRDKVAIFLAKELKILGMTVASGEDFDREKEKVIGRRIVICASSDDAGSQSFYVKKLLDECAPAPGSPVLSKW